MVYHPCYLSGLSIDEEADQQTVLISESTGKRRFPIAIGQIEALAIDRAVKGQVFPRPLTHDLLLVTLDAMHGELTEIRITDLRSGTFYAEIAVTRHDGTQAEIDCRPSDALAILVRRPAVRFVVAEAVLAEAGA